MPPIEVGTANINDFTNSVEKVKSLEEKEKLFYRFKRKLYFAVKRLFDLMCAVIGIFALLPVAIITKICYLLTGDTKSIFYTQKRIGKNGKFIYIYKFRSNEYKE